MTKRKRLTDVKSDFWHFWSYKPKNVSLRLFGISWSHVMFKKQGHNIRMSLRRSQRWTDGCESPQIWISVWRAADFSERLKNLNPCHFPFINTANVKIKGKHMPISPKIIDLLFKVRPVNLLDQYKPWGTDQAKKWNVKKLTQFCSSAGM